MGKLFKSKKSKIIAIVLASILVVGAGVGGFIIYKLNKPPKGLKFDYATGSIVKERVESAQYLPDVNLLATPEIANTSLSNSALTTHNATINFNQDDYNKIVDELATITGTAVRNTTSILDIKDEIYTVLNMVPAFGQWFQLPQYFEAKHAQDGYNYYFYKLDYDNETSKISITRMTWSYACSVYSSSENKIYSTYYNDDVKQYQIMQTNYYYNEDNKEVVECSVVDFLKFNDNFYPIQCQYLENIEDTSTTKIQTVLRKELNAYSEKITNNASGNVVGGYDIDTNPSGGIMTKVIQLNYTDMHNIELMKIEQNSHTDYYSNIDTTNIAYYLKQHQNTVYYTNSWDYFDSANSKDAIELNDIFQLRETTKAQVLESFTKSNYITRQVMGTFNSSSVTVCTDCYNKTIDSGILMYKCNHNKNLDTVARSTSQVLVSSSAYQSEVVKILPWYIANHLKKFASNIGLKENEFLTSAKAICSDLTLETYKFQSNIDIFLDEISNKFINNISLCSSVKSLYETITAESIKLKKSQLNESAIATEIELENLTASAVVQKTIVKVSAKATLKKSNLLQKGTMYSLSFVMHDQTSNSTYTLISHYVEYTGSTLELSVTGQYNLKAFTLNKKDAHLNNSLRFTGYYALTKRTPLGDVVCSKLHDTIVNDTNIDMFETKSNGYNCSFTPSIKDGILTMTVNFVDALKPVVNIEGIDNTTVTLKMGAKVSDLLRLITISENDSIEQFKLTHGTTEYTTLNDTLASGEHTITTKDRTGNVEEFKFTVKISVLA